MMLALLVYCYCNGIFSSRKIERATYRDVAVRYLTVDTHPDHDTICKFRRENLPAISGAFIDIAELMAQAEKADNTEADDQGLPEEISRRENLKAKMDQAIAELEKRAAKEQ